MRAVYVRTSTAEQDGAAQHHALEKAAAARGWTGHRTFTDRGVSGAKASRPALDELRRAARAGELREVLVYALDRVGRSAVDVIAVLDEWSRLGVVVHSLREGTIDPASPVGRFTTQILVALAEMERGLIRERVIAGVRKAQATGTRSGRAIGRPQRDFDVNLARKLRADGRSWRAIAVAVKVPTATVRRHLRDASRRECTAR